jgi:hypothetical protein
MTDKAFDVIELYPKIFVYKNLFKDIKNTHKILKDSNGDEDGLLKAWSQWSHFGEYLDRPFNDHPSRLTVKYLNEMETKTEKEEIHRLLILEIIENFHIATKDYIFKNNVIFDEHKILTEEIDQHGRPIDEWVVTGPSIARYKTDIADPVAMMYHSDYIRKPIRNPGHEFAITALTYFNDDYEGGEIDFIVNGEAYMYKPEAGDLLVFPSGHPDILTNNDNVYIHGVMPASGPSKYLCRMYWMKYHPGDPEWFEKEKEFGKDVWEKMQEDIMQKFRDDHPNKGNADKEKRIK